MPASKYTEAQRAEALALYETHGPSTQTALEAQMNVNELNGSHVGRKVTATLADRDVQVTGVLAGIHHAADAMTEMNLGGVAKTLMGQPYTVLKFLHAGEFRATRGTVEVFPEGAQ